MLRDKSNKLGLLIPMVLMGICLFADFANSANAIFPNPQGPEKVVTPPMTQQVFCKTLIKDELVELCGNLQLEKLPPIVGLKIEDRLSFVKDVHEPIKIFMDPERFKKTTKNPEKLVRRLGFKNLDQLEKVKPDAVLVIRRVKIDELENFSIGNDPDNLMHFGDRLIVPLIIPEGDGTVAREKSSLTFGLFKDKNEWRWTRRGAPGRMRKIYQYRNGAQDLVQIPGLNLYFLRKHENGQNILISLYDYKFKNIELKAGVGQPADKIFAGLSEEVKEILKRVRKDPPPWLH